MGFLSALPVVGKVIDSVCNIIDEAVEDKDLANKLKNELRINQLSKLSSLAQKELDAQAQTITAEIQGESWLQRNWRPILMLTFTYIIAHNYVLAPIFSFPCAKIPPDMWQLLKIGVGGYIIGRSAEKVIPTIKNQRS